MGVKKKEKIMEPVILEYTKLLIDSEVNSLECLSHFINARDAKTQLVALKQCSCWLKSQDDEVNLRSAVQILVSAFFECQPKNQLRKPIISCLQSVPQTKHPLVVDALQRHVLNVAGNYGNSKEKSNHGNRRKSIDNMAAMLDNFTLGERSLVAVFEKVLPYLTDTFKQFYEEAKSSSGEEAETISMHNVLATSQFFNKLLQKSLTSMTQRSADGDENSIPQETETSSRTSPDPGNSIQTGTSSRTSPDPENSIPQGTETSSRTSPDPENSIPHDTETSSRTSPDAGSLVRGVVDDPGVIQCMLEICAVMWAVLNEAFLLDCRTACGMGVPLILKAIYGPQQLVQILHLDKSSKPSAMDKSSDAPPSTPAPSLDPPPRPPAPSYPVGALSDSSHLCVLGGLLAMSARDELLTLTPGGALITVVIGRSTLWLTTRLQDTNTKLMASRTLVLLTNKLCDLLTCDPEAESLKRDLTGETSLVSRIIAYAWNHWEDTVDTIRHQTRTVFQNIVKTHLLASGEDAATSPFIHKMAASLLSMSLHTRGRYGPLVCVVDHIGAMALLSIQPNLPQQLLSAMKEQALAPYVSELYQKLYLTHRKELQNSAVKSGNSKQNGYHGDIGIHGEDWTVTWVDPVLNRLCQSDTSQNTYIIEYVVPALLKQCPDVFSHIVQQLTKGKDHTPNIGALVTCIKQAKSLGILREVKGRDGLWCGVVSMETIVQALCHSEDQIRLDALALLCDNHKTTEVMTSCDLDLVRYFLRYNMASQEPGFRQHMVATLKKLFIRLKDGGRSLAKAVSVSNRTYTSSLAVTAGNTSSAASTSLAAYHTFLTWLCDWLFSQLHQGAAFTHRTTAAAILAMMVHVMGAGEGTAPGEFRLSDTLTPARAQTLLEGLTDTFEHNKQDVYSVLAAVPPHSLLKDTAALHSVLSAARALLCTPRPQDSTTAAYLLKVALLHPGVTQVTSQVKGQPEVTSQDKGQAEVTSQVKGQPEVTSQVKGQPEGGKSAPQCAVVSVLLDDLTDQLRVAQQSLLHAAATRPLYPTLHCVRYVMADMDLRSSGPEWTPLIARLITLCFGVADVVFPVVSNSSPEGNIPEETLADLPVPPSDPADTPATPQVSVDASVAKVTSMPEYLVVCCWRSIKEVSLLLGQLTDTATLAGEGQGQGHLTMEQLHAVGAYFTTQLLESRHRGAFELAYAGFVKMAARLWRCGVAGAAGLPRRWLTEILAAVGDDDPQDKLCATRRSAGVPFYIQALVSTEPPTTGRPCLKVVMETLLRLAWPTPGQSPHTENIPQVHALNILRALYRDTRLGEDVFVYVAEGVQVATLGYASQLWSIRNSSTLLFSALMTRIFGVKRTKDELSRKNCMTGRVFFHRFPSLHGFLKKQLLEATATMGSPSDTTSQLHPGLYPVLLVLGRLYPSVIEGADSSCHLQSFVDPVLKCAHSPVYKTRMMAARALCPLVGKEDIKLVLRQLVNKIPDAPRGVSQNALHGILLQIELLLAGTRELPSDLQHEVLDIVGQRLNNVTWLYQSDSDSYVVKTSFLRSVHIVYKHMLYLRQERMSVQNYLSDQHSQLIEAVFFDEGKQLGGLIHIPGAVQYLENAACCLLSMMASNTERFQSSVVKLLKANIYEVRLQALNFLLASCETNCAEASSSDSHDQDCDMRVPESLAEGVVSISQNSQPLMEQLVSMVMVNEHHFECLEKALRLIFYQKTCGSVEWKTGKEKYSVIQVLSRLQDICSDQNREELCCAAIKVWSRFIEQLHYDDSQLPCDWLTQWACLLEARCGEESGSDLKCEIAAAIVRTSGVLLDSTQVGPVMRLWTLVVLLLQDEDLDVRHQMAVLVGCLHGHTQKAPPSIYHPSLALPRLIQSLLTTRWSPQCLSTILEWAESGGQQDDQSQSAQDVRLFDRGELNSYLDHDTTSQLIGRLLIALTTASVSDDPDLHHIKDMSHGEGGRKLKLGDEFLNVLCQKQTDLLGKISRTLEEVTPLDRSAPFLRHTEYVSLRQTLSGSVFTLSVVQKILAEHQPASVVVERTDKIRRLCSEKIMFECDLCEKIRKLL